jgi:hypothetical protein
VELVHEVKRDRKALMTILEVRDHFVIVAEEGNNEGSKFQILVFEEVKCTLHSPIKGR